MYVREEEGRPRTCADGVGAQGREGDVVGWQGRVGDQGHVEMSSRKTQVSFSLRHEPLKYSCVKCQVLLCQAPACENGNTVRKQVATQS
jgi:hypothetical protein